MRKIVSERSVGITVSIPLPIIVALDEVSRGQMGGRSALVVAALASFLASYRPPGGDGPAYTVEELVPPNHPAYHLLAAQQVVREREEGLSSHRGK